MKIIKIIGTFVLYIVLFSFSWLLNLLICGIVGSFYHDGANETTGAIYSYSMLIIPPIASILEIKALKRKWAQKRIGHSNPDSLINYLRGVSNDIPLDDNPDVYVPAIETKMTLPQNLVKQNQAAAARKGGSTPPKSVDEIIADAYNNLF